MTPQRMSSRKSELAVWLREGLVKLGPTFIKVRARARGGAVNSRGAHNAKGFWWCV
jgi:hypothetical protein